MITAKLLTSEPVPLVVGIAMKQIFLNFSSIRRAMKTIAFAASMDAPPPRQITVSGTKATSFSTPPVTTPRSGSAATSEYTSYSFPARSSLSVTYFTLPLTAMK